MGPLMKVNILTTLLATVALAACASGANSARADDDRDSDHEGGRFSFAVGGDIPYSDAEALKMDRLIAEVNADHGVRFTLHVGDFKGGSQRCDDALFVTRLQQLQTFARALVFTPGDNDWTDCHRTSNGNYNPLERLARVRALFYPEPHRTLGQRPLKVHTQADVPGFATFVENTLFVRKGVVFSAVHVVGSNNNLAPWNQIYPDDSYDTPRAERVEEFKSREAAALDWLDRSFAHAASIDAAGIVVFMQANPRFNLAPNERERQGFNAVLARLNERTIAFGKPVLLIQGDDHEFIVDKPWDTFTSNPRVENFTRLQGFGSPRVNWVKVRVDRRTLGLFSVEQRIVK